MTKPDERRRSWHHQSVDDETLAKYTAARAFLFAEWIGALMMVASFTVLYWLILARSELGGPGVLALSIALLILGTVLYWRNRTIYYSLDFPFRKRLEVVATVLAGSAGIFWLLFVILAVLVWRGVPILPAD